ncbi:MAG: hypothetical protein PSX79_13990 [bacterium]|nr:hypothetical protein [bacterium]
MTQMMRAERARRADRGLDTAWLLFGPEDAEVVACEDEPPERLLAAE